MEVLNVDVMNHLLQASGTPPNEIPDYDDWLGARKFSGTWEEEDDMEE